MNPESANLLEQLKDIHGAPNAPWWPPAPGWWIIAFLLILVLFLLGKRLFGFLQVRRRRKAWLDYLDLSVSEINADSQPHYFLARINEVFKVIAIRAFPEESSARLEGSSWVSFLQAKMGQVPTDSLQILADGPYQPAPEYDAGEMTRLARHWIQRYG